MSQKATTQNDLISGHYTVLTISLQCNVNIGSLTTAGQLPGDWLGLSCLTIGAPNQWDADSAVPVFMACPHDMP